MKKIFKTILLIYVPSILLIILLYKFSAIEYRTFLSSIWAVLLNLLNLILAISLYQLSIGKSNQIFMILNLGGMGGRVFFMLFCFVLILIFLEIDTIALILVFLIFYSLSLVIEIKYFNKTAQKERK